MSFETSDLKTLVGDAATVCTIILFLTGIQICKKIRNKRSTSDISALPFVCGLVSSSLWLRYGLVLQDTVVTTVNLIGCILQILYLSFYAVYSTNRSMFMKQLITALSVLGFLFFTSAWMSDFEASKRFSGFMACGAGILFMASPLASAARVMQTKSTESLPFLMILFSFIMASLWVWYGCLLGDAFIQIPNFLGALLTGFQLCLFIIYPPKKEDYEPNFA